MELMLRRKAKNLRQEDVANHLGVNRSTVTKWELGEAFPRHQLLPKLASLLNISEGEIITAISAVRGERVDPDPPHTVT